MGEGIGYYIDHGRLVPLCLVKKRYKTKQLLKVAALMTWQNTAQGNAASGNIYCVPQFRAKSYKKLLWSEEVRVFVRCKIFFF